MSTQVIEHDGRLYRPESGLRRGIRGLRRRLGLTAGEAVATAAKVTLSVVKAKATPAVSHIREHAYTIMGLGTFDAAMFYHSMFTGLLVTGISWFVFEFKASDSDKEG